MTDDELLAELRTAAERADPVPDLVLRQARAALSTRDPDAELAELAFDSDLASPAAVRAPAGDTRLLSFTASREVSVELQVEPASGRVLVRGLVTGATGEAILETASAGRRTHPIDDEGWFTAENLPHGATRIHLRTPHGTTVTTGWTTL